ncbi:MAG: polysaccharide biosynthesis protein [Clostridia bacterium]
MNKSVNLISTKKPNNFVTGALIISIGGLVAKFLGAIYRIPLTNLVGSYGMGLYQLVFPPYILIMILASFGIPSALSKLLAECYQLGDYKQSQILFKRAFMFLLTTGSLGSILLFCLAPLLASWQQTPEITLAYRIASPAILFVCLTGAFKGYFQGNMKMMPISLTQVAEQIVKLLFGLGFAVLFLPDIVRAVNGAVIAITVSEFASFIIMSITYFRYDKKLAHSNNIQTDDSLSKIFTLALPIVMGSFIMQMSQLVDSIMVVNLVNAPNATSLYGLWTGPVNSLLGFPIALSAGVAVSALPSITRTAVGKNRQHLISKYNSAFKLTILVALPSALGLMVLSKPIISLLYASLPLEEIEIASKLLMYSGLSILFLSLVQTMTATLQALSKPYVAVVIVVGAVAIKLIVNYILLPLKNVDIYGAALSETFCYLFACICGIIYLKVRSNLSIDIVNSLLKPIACNAIMLTGLLVITTFATDFVATITGTLVSILLCIVIYVASAFALKVFTKEELDLAKFNKKDKANDNIRNTKTVFEGQKKL